MEPILEPAPWLSGERIGLRAPLLDDVPVAGRWYIGEGATDAATVERELVRRETIPWGGNPVITLVAIDRATGEVAGGVVATRAAGRTCRLELKVAPERDDRAEVLADTLGLVVPWLLEEIGLMTVVVQAAADDDALITAAAAAGMVVVVRRREHVRRAEGRVDLLELERVNSGWGDHAS